MINAHKARGSFFYVEIVSHLRVNIVSLDQWAGEVEFLYSRRNRCIVKS